MQDIIDNILTPKTITLIESTYYHDISNADLWSQLIAKFMANNTDLAAQIELLADNGIANVRRLISLCLHNFKVAYNIFINAASIDDSQLQVIQFYLTLLGYFHNCYDNETNKFLMQLPKSEKIGFFYHANIDDTLSVIYNESKATIDIIADNLNKTCGHQPDTTTILRELLALPFLIEDLNLKDINNLGAFRDILLTNLHDLLNKNEENLAIKIKNFYSDNIDSLAFSWLKEVVPENSFIYNLINTVYIFVFIKKIYFSCGSKKLYGYHQRLIDKQSGNVLYSIPYKTQMFLLKGTSALVAGQANIDNIEILPNGNLLINFKHGLFLDDTTTDQASFNAALALNEDLPSCLSIFNTFLQSAHNKTVKYNLLLESPHENSPFSEKVQEQICYLNHEISEAVKIVPSLKIASKIEKDRYLAENDMVLSVELKEQIINNIRLAGYKANFVIPDFAFQGVKLIELTPQDILCEEGNPSVFVYIPFEEGLVGHSVSENMNFRPKAWAPVGHIGAIQDDLRTATIVAEKKVNLLMIPANLYLRYWHIDYTVNELNKRIGELSSLSSNLK